MYTDSSNLVNLANQELQAAIRKYKDWEIGTVAANEQIPHEENINYSHCFIRDFVPSALIFLMQGKREIVRNFLEVTLGLQFIPQDAQEVLVETDGLFKIGRQALEPHDQLFDFQPRFGLMPASFVVEKDEQTGNERIKADFGQSAIGRVAPADSGLWWIFILRAYEKACETANCPQDSIRKRPEFQRGMQYILELCLLKRFDTFPTLLVPDGAFMIDRRLGVYGSPLEIQSLFYIALRAAHELLMPETYQELNQDIWQFEKRFKKLEEHIQLHYWLDAVNLRKIYRAKTEEFDEQISTNPFNIHANSVPEWVLEFVGKKGGYFVGNLGVSWIDFRFFSQGNMLAIISDLATQEQAQKLMNLMELQWEKLVGKMPLKICYPALIKREWEMITGFDPKNIPWSYHNGGNWPVLLWSFVAAAQKIGKWELAQKAIAVAEESLMLDQWPEYYEGEKGQLIGRQARLYQTWTIASYLVSKYLMANPEHLSLIQFDYSCFK